MGSSKPSGNSDRRAKKGPTQRQLRVAENLRHELSQIFTRIDIRDEDLLDVMTNSMKSTTKEKL